MVKKMKLLVSVKGVEEKIGPITCCIIGVDTNIERSFDLKTLIKNKSDKIMDQKLLILKHYFMSKIDAKDVDNTSKQVSKFVFDTINTVHEFWNHDIYIVSKNVFLSDLDRETSLAKNISKAKIYIGEHVLSKILTSLVDYVHSLYYDKELKLIKAVYGDSECIHTRK
jgi:hypothetical protein